MTIDVPGKYSCQAKAPLKFHPDRETLTGKGTLAMEDMNCTISAAASCSVKSAHESLKYKITLERDSGQAQPYFSSTGAGLITFTCGDEAQGSSSTHTYLIATFWGDNRSTAELTTFEGCDSRATLW